MTPTSWSLHGMGNSVTIEDSGGTQYKRNSRFVNKFFSENENDDLESKPVKSGTENT